MLLPIFHTAIQELSLMQTKWASILNPIISRPTNQSSIIEANVVSGVNVINHLLGRKPQGWIVTDINAAVTLYRSSAFNPLTLTLTASGTAQVSLEVF